MDVVSVLHMNGGTGEASYANNSLLQVCIYNSIIKYTSIYFNLDINIQLSNLERLGKLNTLITL